MRRLGPAGPCQEGTKDALPAGMLCATLKPFALGALAVLCATLDPPALECGIPSCAAYMFCICLAATTIPPPVLSVAVLLQAVHAVYLAQWPVRCKERCASRRRLHALLAVPTCALTCVYAIEKFRDLGCCQE